MRLNTYLPLFALLFSFFAFSQVKVGSNPNVIDSASILELESANKALVLTRLTSAQMQSIAPLNGALAYNIETSCVHYYNGTQWVNLCNSSNTTGFSFSDNGDGTITLSDALGNDLTFNGAPETITTLVNNLDGTYTFTNENGDSTILSTSGFSGDFTDLTNVPANLDTDATDDFDGEWSSLNNVPAGFADDIDNDTQLTDAQVATAVNNEFPNLDTDATDDFDGEWSSLNNVPAGFADDIDNDTQLTDAQVATAVNNEFPNLDTDATDDFSGDFTDLTNVPANLDTDATDDFDGEWSSLNNVPAGFADDIDNDTQLTDAQVATAVNNEFPNLDTDATDDFDGEWSSLNNVPAGFADDIDNDTQLTDAQVATAVNNEFPNLDTDATDDFDGEWSSLNNVPADIADGDDDTVTNLTQNTSTGVITYTNENSTDQTANTVGSETNNSISVGANGGAYYESPIKAFGKIASNGNVTRATAGITVTQLGGNGYYRVNLPAGLVSDGNYIIQLAQPSRDGAGNDDPGISYRNQLSTGFEVIIGDNDNGGSDRNRFNSEFMFTILDL